MIRGKYVRFFGRKCTRLELIGMVKGLVYDGNGPVFCRCSTLLGNIQKGVGAECSSC